MSYVFSPSDPSDRHLTEVERQDWLRDLEDKKDDFPYIALTRAQMKLLKQSEKDVVLVTPENENDVDVLSDHRFIYVLANDGKRGCIIRQRGANYIAYVQKESKTAKSITARDCFVALISAIFGFLLNCLFSG